jgi:hypothetical protein
MAPLPVEQVVPEQVPPLLEEDVLPERQSRC